MQSASSARAVAADPAAATDSPLLRAYRGEPVARIPVWFMRQAGRSLPEYRAIRTTGGLFEITHEPELAAEVTLQPVRRYGVDAAILFSDIMTPLEAIGVGVEIRPGVGPVIEAPIRAARDLAVLRAFEPDDDAPWLAESVRLVTAELTVPLIGFAGGPFTLASYLVEGGPSRTHARTKALMLSQPALWRDLLERLSRIAVASLEAQVRAGARAVQIFDSWIGSLALDDYRQHVLPVVTGMFEALAGLGVPRVYFAVGAGHLIEPMSESGCDVLSLDWRLPLDHARARLTDPVGLQGNLDPAACLSDWPVLSRRVLDVLERAPEHGYVFNLGHGVLPETDPSALERVVELVHGYERRAQAGEPRD